MHLPIQSKIKNCFRITSLTQFNSMDISGSNNIAMVRCDHLINRYLYEKIKSGNRSIYAQVASLFLTAITPVLLLAPTNKDQQQQYLRLFAAAASAGAAVSTGLLSICRWPQTYERCGHTYHSLQNEKSLYLTKASDDYAGLEEAKAAQNFSRRINSIYMAEVTDWRSELQRINKEPPQ